MARLFRKYVLRHIPRLQPCIDQDLEDVLLPNPFGLAQVTGQQQAKKHRGSVFGRKYVVHERHEADARLGRDYFDQNCKFDATGSRREFRLRRELFLRITDTLENKYKYFKHRPDATGDMSCTAHQKVTCAIKMLATGMSAFSLRREFGMGESTVIETTKQFAAAIMEEFGEEYLRRPNSADLARLLAKAEERGFPGMLGSLDCMHWRWEMCPVGWHGQYIGHIHEPTVILEAVADHELWIWHASFGLPGSLNDINVLQRSHLFVDVLTGRAPNVKFKVNGQEYDMGYYLADGIYPAWATLVNGIPLAHNEKHPHFTMLQSAYRKDVERAFGVLQARYHIVKYPARTWYPDTMEDIMKCCIILHNMTIEDERSGPPPTVQDYNDASEPSVQQALREEILQRHCKIRCSQTHSKLRDDLVEHVWQHVPCRH